MDLQKPLEVCKKLAVSAGQAILEIYNKNYTIEYKDDHSPLTEADKASNEIIVEGLRKEFPDWAILSEESKDDKSRLDNDWCFIVDPLDGTKEFIKKNGEFTVNIGLSYKHKVVVGVIYVPVTEELYFSAKGYGAYLIKSGNSIRLKVSDKTQNLTLVGSKSHASDELKKLINDNKDRIKDIRSAGSSLKGCMVAKGEADIYYRFGYTCEWDTAAMQCIAEEAGGIFRQMDDTEMLYNRENNLNDKGFYIINTKENKF